MDSVEVTAYRVVCLPSAIAVCSSSESSVDRLSSTLKEAGWDELVIVRSALDVPVPERVAACILMSTSEGQDVQLFTRLQDLGGRVPLIVIGDEPPAVGGVTCWLRSIPSATVLGALVDGVLGSGPAAKWNSVAPRERVPDSRKSRSSSWRRKTDFIVGDSPATERLLDELERLAPSPQLVLVTGESGTGKELVARGLHYCGPRVNEPFVAINCAAIPDTLVEAELFGYQRGAFTGAATSRGGAFEAAQKGTLFLDEIGEISRAAQAKLLRVLETNEVTRLGSTEPRPVLARVVAATNRDLEEEVRAGRFREDLFYRLHVYPVHIEPLRNRPEDIPPIVSHHLSLIATREKRPTPRLTASALERLLTHSWPGNVRELVHVLTRAILSSTNIIDAEHITVRDSSIRRAVSRYRDAKHSFERDYYTQLMKVVGGNVALAARLADKTRKEVYDALKRLELEVVDYRARTDDTDASS
jgi:transcriptional regulator with GAF, ATPase, and Fis domain